MKFRKILCAVSVDPLAEPVFAVACELARELKAELGVVSIVDLANFQMGDGINVEDVRNSLRKEVSSLFESLTAKREFRIQEFCDEGDPKELIVATARDWQADLIVIASHSRTGFSRFLMGSVAESVLRASPCPVLIIPSQKSAKT